MTAANGKLPSVVEVRPEVVFLYELLQELTEGRLRIPRFQRPFVWRRDQMTDLLDSVYNQYPIGSLLVWETDEPIATLTRLGPFHFPLPESQAGYLLDGHQRLSTLASALIPRESYEVDSSDQDPSRWNLVWNMEQRRFQHGRAEDDPATLFPLTALLDTLHFFSAADTVRSARMAAGRSAKETIATVSQVARAFQHYRVPVIRIRQTALSEAVEIFARLNSRGQAMSADQMVSALTYRQSGDDGAEFDLASEIDGLSAQLGEEGFGDVDRTTILRAILASLDEDIYKTDWTRLAGIRRDEMLPRLRQGVRQTSKSLDKAVAFLKDEGVKTSRLLPYTMQLALLSAYFDSQPEPDVEQLTFLRRWFWVSSFSGWFGGANPSRVNSLISEFRKTVSKRAPDRLENFDIDAMALPFPATFDMRSARTRTLLLVMLSLQPRDADGRILAEPWRTIAERGPDAVGYVFSDLPRDLLGNPANRMIRPPGAERGQLRSWLRHEFAGTDHAILASYAINNDAWGGLVNGDARAFVLARQAFLIDREHHFQSAVGVRPSDVATGGSPIDTD